MKLLKIFLRIIIVLILTAAIAVAGILGAVFILERGPSPEATRLFVLSVKETSAAYFLADLFLSNKEVNTIVAAQGASDEPSETVAPELISLPSKQNEETSADTAPSSETSGTDETVPAAAVQTEAGAETSGDTEDLQQDSGIEIVDVTGKGYRGKMLIISDPTRVFVGIPPEGFGADKSGMTVYDMCQKYGALGGINGGGFVDPNGTGTGGIPDGLVIHDSKLLWGSESGSYSIVGLDADGLLYVGSMTGKRALELNMKYAVSFGPALIINGVPQNEKYSLGGGVNPRTAIGQRADGAILMLVINGRQVDSIGATFDDLVTVMLDFGAVNAANLDGGSSSMMIYRGEYMITSAYVFGERVVATAFLVGK
jgi:Exopolysaccharide biosynthesis protein related to N-acetylglucosamine-1-phosphodiester alpha-N-acetylglucosaminidase